MEEPKEWLELILTVSQEQKETAEAIAALAETEGMMIEDYAELEADVREIAHIDLIDEALIAKQRDTVRLHFYCRTPEERLEKRSFLLERFAAAGIQADCEMETLYPADWKETWKQYYHPMRIGKRLLLCPSWETAEPAGDEVRMILDPGMAFGTGSHETTRLCIELLQDGSLENRRILDIGCGSGILAICALLLGGESAVGCDIDPLAVKTAKENAARNGVAERVEFIEGSLTEKITGRYDVICANIVADVILQLMPDLHRFLQPDGTFIASGILNTRFDEVKAGALAAGLTLTAVRQQGSWTAFAAKF